MRNGKLGKRRKMSAAGRSAISKATKAGWAKFHAAKAGGMPDTEPDGWLYPRSFGYRGGNVITGQASDDRERFEFTIEPFVSGGFVLGIRYSGDRISNITGAGVWPTVEKAKQIAEKTARRLLHGATVAWQAHTN